MPPLDGALVSPTEPLAIKALGRSSSIPERWGADVLWGGQHVGLVTVQRKEFSDLVASIQDGRLGKEVAQMQAVEGLRVLVVEGRPRWTLDGELVDGWSRVTRHQLRALLWSVRAKGLWVETSDDVHDTVNLLRQLYAWTMKPRHESMNRMPGVRGDGWGVVGNKDYARHLLTAFPGVGIELAGRIIDHFGKVPLSWDVSEEQLREVEGIGKVRARQLVRALEVHGG